MLADEFSTNNLRQRFKPGYDVKPHHQFSNTSVKGLWHRLWQMKTPVFSQEELLLIYLSIVALKSEAHGHCSSTYAHPPAEWPCYPLSDLMAVLGHMASPFVLDALRWR